MKLAFAGFSCFHKIIRPSERGVWRGWILRYDMLARMLVLLEGVAGVGGIGAGFRGESCDEQLILCVQQPILLQNKAEGCVLFEQGVRDPRDASSEVGDRGIELFFGDLLMSPHAIIELLMLRSVFVPEVLQHADYLIDGTLILYCVCQDIVDNRTIHRKVRSFFKKWEMLILLL